MEPERPALVDPPVTIDTAPDEPTTAVPLLSTRLPLLPVALDVPVPNSMTPVAFGDDPVCTVTPPDVPDDVMVPLEAPTAPDVPATTSPLTRTMAPLLPVAVDAPLEKVKQQTTRRGSARKVHGIPRLRPLRVRASVPVRASVVRVLRWRG